MAEIETIKAILAEKGMQLSETLLWKDLQYCWADLIYPNSGAVFAKYLLLSLSLKEWEEFRSTEEQFSADAVERIYYTLRSDLCWNLYLVCIFSDKDFAQIDRHSRFEFESSTEYTRKLVLRESEIRDRLPVGYTLLRPEEQPAAQPEQEWQDVLTEEYEFCLNGFDSARFKQIASGSVSRQKASVSTLFMSPEEILSVQHIHIPKEFRPHFYSDTIELPCCKANLLAGPNGAGKTSVFSAIELAMTGSVQKQCKVPHDPTEKSDVSVRLQRNQDAISIYKASTPGEKKEREAKWYSSRAENRTAEQLNVLFHRFNYFSVDETYLFAREQPDHSDIFSKILYGPETTAKWKNIEIWKEKCKQEVAQLESAYKRLRDTQKDLPEKMVDEHGLRSYIAQSGLNIAPNASFEEILETAARIQAEINQLRAYELIPSQSDALAGQQQTAKQIRSESTRNSELISRLKAYEDAQKGWEQQIEQIQKRWKHVKKTMDALSPLQGLLKQLTFMAGHQEAFTRVGHLRQEIEKQEEELGKLEMYWKKHSKVKFCKSIPNICAEDTLDALDARLHKIGVEIDQTQKQMDRQNQLLGQLRSIGEQLADQNPLMHQCPLCGTENIGAQDILQHLRKEQEGVSAELSSLYLEQKAIQDRKENLLLVKAAWSAHRDAQRLYPELRETEPLASLEYVHKMQAQRSNDLKELKNSFRHLDDELRQRCAAELGNIDFDDLFFAESHAQSILTQNGYTECDNLTGAQLILRIPEINLELHLEVTNLETEFAALRTESKEDLIKSLRAEQEDCQKQIRTLEAAAKRWDRLLQFWENVSPRLKNGVSDMDGAALQAHCEKLKSDVENITRYSKRRDAKDAMTANRTSWRAYKDVFDRLEELRKPEDYAQEFIKQNIEQISRIFLSLHLPQEFSCLEMDENHLIGRRGEEKVPVVNMSTGQRTALVLSVFFQLHLSNSAAPKFLLIDEPVANIDDLNILSLMDFLRELVISHGRQVFFTTASRNVAQLFRRKFSFLEKDFQHLYFARRSTDELEIWQKTYDQEKLLTSNNLISNHKDMGAAGGQ